MRSHCSGLVRQCRSVASPATIALDLTADCRRRSAQLCCNRANRLPCNDGSRDLLALCQRQREPRTPASRWTDAARLSKHAPYRRVRPVEQASDLMERRPLLPAFPHQCTLALGVVDPRSLVHLHTPSARAELSVLHPPVESAAERCQSAMAVAVAAWWAVAGSATTRLRTRSAPRRPTRGRAPGSRTTRR